MIIPPYLKPGDAVTLISPARFMDMGALESFQEWVIEQGWILQLAPSLGARFHQFGGSQAERLSDIIWALNQTDIKAVFTARGGYGCMQLLSELRKLDFVEKPKWWIGFSDITSIHITLNQQGLSSMHGPMAMQFLEESRCSKTSRSALSDRLKGQEYRLNVAADNLVVGQPHYIGVSSDKSFSGLLWGGNLSMIFAMLAAGAMPPKGPIVLFIEDLDEYLYHIDRMLQAVFNSGFLDNTVAVIAGSMMDMHDNAIPFGKNAKEIVMEFCEKSQKPLIWGIPAGHDAENIALKLGLDITFDGSTLKQN